MEEQTKNVQSEEQVSDDQLQEVAGGNSIQQRRLEQLDTNDQSKSVENIQQHRLEQLDTNDQSK
ncbi:MAG: hypothetical protein AAF152_04970 [Cyanobacteria bacterium P01_A01_bin.114]